MTAADAMHPGVATVHLEQPANEVLQYLLSQRISGAAVIDADDRPHGVITLADLAAQAAGMEREHPARHLAELSQPPKLEQPWQRDFLDTHPVKELMTPFIVRVHESTPLSEVTTLMVTTGIHRVFVTRDEKLLGVISSMDLVALLGKLLQEGEGCPG